MRPVRSAITSPTRGRAIFESTNHSPRNVTASQNSCGRKVVHVHLRQAATALGSLVGCLGGLRCGFDQDGKHCHL